MSGQLVGEVIAASSAFRAAGLSERGFHALVAIAEKCHTQTRQGSVPWKHICDGLFGASKRTAERAVQDLKTFGAIRIVKSGFNNNAGRVCAPIYEIGALTDTDTQVTRSGGTDTDKPATDTDKPATDTDTQVSYLTGLLTGLLTGARPECSRHKENSDTGCRACMKRRQWDEAHEQSQRAAAEARATAIRTAIDDCPDCDSAGRLDDLSDCPKHPNFRKASAA